MNQDERRAKKIVSEEAIIPDFDRLFQDFLKSDYRKGLGNVKPYALAVAFSLWLKEKLK